jgi:hypothetical protein
MSTNSSKRMVRTNNKQSGSNFWTDTLNTDEHRRMIKRLYRLYFTHEPLFADYMSWLEQFLPHGLSHEEARTMCFLQKYMIE